MTAPRDARHEATLRAPSGAGSAEWEEVRRGLCATPRTLPPKLFYDAEGARLFERICEQPEYYLTRAELSILRARVGEIARLAGPDCALVEYGSGAGVKVRLLLDALERPAAYVPIDVSREQLARVAAELQREYPAVRVAPLWADYTRPLALPELPAGARRLAFFPGSTLGNFHPTDAAAFLRRVRVTVGAGGALVLGVDRRKSEEVLNAAYDDAAGVTAAFNLNVLRRLNRDFGGDFDLGRWRHEAFFDAGESRVEMHLVSTAEQEVRVAGTRTRFRTGETIWTESSYKYDRPRLDALASAAGFAPARVWTDRDERFWVAFLEAA